MNNPSRFEQGNDAYLRATWLRESGRYKESIELYEEAFEILSEVANKALLTCLLYDKSIALDLNGLPSEAVNSFERCLALFTSIGLEEPEETRANLQALIEQIEDHLAVARTANGYSDTNYLRYIRERPWQSKSSPIGVYIDCSDKAGYDSSLAELVWSGFLIWLDDKNPLQLERVQSRDQASIEIFRVSDKLGPAAGQTEFIDRTDSSGRTWLTKASIRMYTSSRFEEELSSDELKKFFSLACHEAGHALGLDGHSPYGSDLMYFKSPLVEPSLRDLESLRGIYREG